MHRLELDGVTLAYDVYGPAGAPLVLLHALGESRQDWSGIADHCGFGPWNPRLRES